MGVAITAGFMERFQLIINEWLQGFFTIKLPFDIPWIGDTLKTATFEFAIVDAEDKIITLWVQIQPDNTWLPDILRFPFLITLSVEDGSLHVHLDLDLRNLQIFPDHDFLGSVFEGDLVNFLFGPLKILGELGLENLSGRIAKLLPPGTDIQVVNGDLAIKPLEVLIPRERDPKSRVASRRLQPTLAARSASVSTL